MIPLIASTSADGKPLITCPKSDPRCRLFTRSRRPTDRQRTQKKPTLKTEFYCATHGAFDPSDKSRSQENGV